MTPIAYNADRETLAEGGLRTRFGSGWRNYLDGRGQWRKIDFAFASDSGRFSIATAPWLLDCPALANQPIRFEVTNRYEVGGKRIREDAAKGLSKTYHGAASVGGEVTAQGVLYPNAFPGLNASLLIQPSPRGAKMLTVFHSEPPGSGAVEIPFTLDAGGESPLTRTLAEPDLRTRQFLDAGLVIGTDPFRRVTLERPMAWDSGRGRRRRRVPVRLRVERIGGQVVCTKVIPRAFFRGATYPILTDTTTDFYPDGAGGDAIVERSGVSEDFSTIRGGSGVYTDQNSYNYLQCQQNGANDYGVLGRMIQGYDTSAIGSDTINSATLTVFNQGDSSDQASQSLTLSSATAGDITAIVEGDYDGNTGGAEMANRVTIADFITNGSAVFTLNGTGLAHIETAGITIFGIRLSCDYDNSESGFTGSEYPIASMYTANEGGSNRPTLTVDHTGGGGGLAIPIAAYHYNHHLTSMT